MIQPGWNIATLLLGAVINDVSMTWGGGPAMMTFADRGAGGSDQMLTFADIRFFPGSPPRGGKFFGGAFYF